MLISNKKKVIISLTLIVSFFLISTLLLSSINLFSLSKKNIEIGNIALMDKLNTKSVTKLLSYSDKLKLIDYFVEYQNLKSNIKNLSESKLNRLLNLTSILSNYFNKEELEMSEEVIKQVLERYDELSDNLDSNDGDINEIIGNLKSNKALLISVQNMRNDALKLYKQNKISKDTYEGVLANLSEIEYKIKLPTLEERDIELNLNNISYLLDKEKSSYSINADMGAFLDIDKTLEAMSKELESINYITNFVNLTQGNTAIMPSLDVGHYSKIANLANNVDMNLLSDALDFVKDGDDVESYTNTNDYSYPVDFAKTIKTPKIEVEGSVLDAWNLNVDTSSLCLDNLLAPIDMALISNTSLDNIMSSITNVKIPNIGEIINETALPSIIPTVSPSITPTTSVIPTVVPTITPTVSPSIIPTKTATPTISPSIIPTQSPSSEPQENSFWNKIDKKSLYKVINGALVVSGIVILIAIARNKKDIIEHVPFIQSKQSIKQEKVEKIPKTYKQMLIDAGMDVLQDLKKRSKRTKVEKTPREVVYGVLNKLPKDEHNLYFEFLRQFEEVAFYNIEVDEGYYNKFYVICQKILNREAGENINEECDKED